MHRITSRICLFFLLLCAILVGESSASREPDEMGHDFRDSKRRRAVSGLPNYVVILSEFVEEFVAERKEAEWNKGPRSWFSFNRERAAEWALKDAYGRYWAMYNASKIGRMDVVQLILQGPVDYEEWGWEQIFTSNIKAGLDGAASSGNSEVIFFFVIQILSRAFPDQKLLDHATASAAGAGDVESLFFLLNNTFDNGHPSKEGILDSYRQAAHCRQYRTLDLLFALPEKHGVNVQVGVDVALKAAAYGGKGDVVQYILWKLDPRQAPSQDGVNQAVRAAVLCGHTELAKYLFSFPNKQKRPDQNGIGLALLAASDAFRIYHAVQAPAAVLQTAKELIHLVLNLDVHPSRQGFDAALLSAALLAMDCDIRQNFDILLNCSEPHLQPSQSGIDAVLEKAARFYCVGLAESSQSYHASVDLRRHRARLARNAKSVIIQLYNLPEGKPRPSQQGMDAALLRVIESSDIEPYSHLIDLLCEYGSFSPDGVGRAYEAALMNRRLGRVAAYLQTHPKLPSLNHAGWQRAVDWHLTFHLCLMDNTNYQNLSVLLNVFLLKPERQKAICMSKNHYTPKVLQNMAKRDPQRAIDESYRSKLGSDALAEHDIKATIQNYVEVSKIHGAGQVVARILETPFVTASQKAVDDLYANAIQYINKPILRYFSSLGDEYIHPSQEAADRGLGGLLANWNSLEADWNIWDARINRWAIESFMCNAIVMPSQACIDQLFLKIAGEVSWLRTLVCRADLKLIPSRDAVDRVYLDYFKSYGGSLLAYLESNNLGEAQLRPSKAAMYAMMPRYEAPNKAYMGFLEVNHPLLAKDFKRLSDY